jgi:hypothetical protein
MGDEVKRATIYLPADLHRALKLKAAATTRTVSDLVTEAVRLTLAEDVEDLTAIEERKREPVIPFEDFVKQLERDGRL